MVTQVDDDLDLLELMLADHVNASSGYKATARWADYSSRFVEFLRGESLTDFRRRRHPQGSAGSVLASFGALDINPEGVSAEALYHAAQTCLLKNGAVDLDKLQASKVGNPEGFFVRDKFYTYSWLNFYCRYSFVSKYFDFMGKTIVELGPGSGKQAEMLKRAHPSLTIVLFDLPTQLYVCNQYLSKVFEGTGEIIGYRQSRNFETFDDIEPEKINILPHWKFPILDNRSFDLFWNAASLQEMDSATAENYLSIAKGAKYMYLMYNIKYAATAPRPGIRGCIASDTMADFSEVDRVTAKMTWDTNPLYFDSFWMNEAISNKLVSKSSGLSRILSSWFS